MRYTWNWFALGAVLIALSLAGLLPLVIAWPGGLVLIGVGIRKATRRRPA